MRPLNIEQEAARIIEVHIFSPESTKIGYGVEQIGRVFQKSGISLRVRRWDYVPGHVMTIRMHSAKEDIPFTTGANEPSDETYGNEGYSLHCYEEEGMFLFTLRADEEQGLLYGCLEIAEQLEMNGYQGLVSKTEKAWVPIRGAKCNLPWEPYQEGHSTDINQEIYWDLQVWERYLDRLARGRTNMLLLCSQHPYHLMVKVADFPEACPFTDEEMERKTDFWKTLFAMAKVRGINVYLHTFNIHLHEKFARHHGLPIHNVNCELVRNYLRAAIKQIIDEYDDLDGMATIAAERMNGYTQEEIKHFVLDVYFRALKEAKRQVPFLLRSAWLSNQICEIIQLANYSGQVYLDWKFNTSHGLSTWKLSDKEPCPFLDTLPEGTKILWHIRNEEAYLLQWGDPDYVRSHVVNNYTPALSAGYFFGSERVLPFVEEVRLDGEGRRIQTYQFDRRWYLIEMWGRMGYNPDTPKVYWERRLNLHYGLEREQPGLYDAIRAASQVVLEFNTFWGGSWDGTAYAEGNLGLPGGTDAWDGTREKRFISVTDFIFHTCLDKDYMTIPEYVIRMLGPESTSDGLDLDHQVPGRISPFDIARRMTGSRDRMLGYRLAITEQSLMDREPHEAVVEWNWLMEDLTIWSGLAGYYSDKIGASTYLYAYMYTGDTVWQDKAKALLNHAAGIWKEIAEFASSRIARQGYDSFNVFHWERYVEDAYKDIQLAASVKPLNELAAEIRCYALGPYDSDGWGASMDRTEAPEYALADWDGLSDGYLAEAYTIQGRAFVWKELPEHTPSLAVLKSTQVADMIKQLSKRYQISHSFASRLMRDSGTAYFAAVIRSNATEAALYELFTCDYAKVWVNGNEVFQSPKAGWYTQGRQGGRFSALLNEGDNLILIKLEAVRRPLPDSVVVDREDPPAWGFYLRKGFAGYHFERHHNFPYTLVR